MLQHSLSRECFEDTLAIKEPINVSLMCSPFFGQGVLQECEKHISDSHFTHLKLKQQLPGQYDNFFISYSAIGGARMISSLQTHKVEKHHQVYVPIFTALCGWIEEPIQGNNLLNCGPKFISATK